MDRGDALVERWNSADYVQSYLRVMADREYNGREWAQKLEVTTSSTVLDLGCGDGRILMALSPSIRRGIGVDVSEHQLDQARRNFESSAVTNIRLVRSDLRRSTFSAQRIDVVMTTAALHHLTDDDRATLLSGVCEALRPGGLFYFDDDTFNFPPEEFGSRAREIRQGWERQFGRKAYERLKRELYFDDFEMTPYLTDLQEMIEAAGLQIESTRARGLHGATIKARKPRLTVGRAREEEP